MTENRIETVTGSVWDIKYKSHVNMIGTAIL